MLQSTLFGKTSKEPPKDATALSHQLLTQGCFIARVTAGIYSFLPLGWRVLKKIDSIIRDEFEQRGIQDLLMPIVHPASLWEETGRAETMKDIIARFESKRGQDLILAPTHEETVSDLARRYLNSYKDLPVIVNQNQLKFRDETRVQGGILRTREFIMQDAYSFDLDKEGMKKSYELMKEAYIAIFNRIGVTAIPVAADSGAMGGSGSEEFVVLAEVGEDTIVICEECRYRANLEKADSLIETIAQDKEMKPMENVEGKGIIGVEALAKHLGVDAKQTTKTLLFQMEEGSLIAALIRGDYDINEAKLKNTLGGIEIQLASPERIKEVTGAEIGYAGPVNLPDSVKIVADNSIKDRVNFECGGNETNFHLVNVNFERDFPMPDFADIRSVKAGDSCPECKKGKLKQENGIEVGHIFQLGTKYSDSMGIQVPDEEGTMRVIEMGCYGIGMTRVMAATVEQRNDDKGIVWPKNIAPFQVHLIGLNLHTDESLKMKAKELYEDLKKSGIEVLFDDRDISAGKKFADADLIGIPIRLTISARSLENGGIEWKERNQEDSRIVAQKDLIKSLTSFLS
ncbi:MAG: proline--tRNA ligase [bacterium]|nr:proline--tRNA ligase [bacterium]